jgi:hypothetical protein
MNLGRDMPYCSNLRMPELAALQDINKIVNVGELARRPIPHEP